MPSSVMSFFISLAIVFALLAVVESQMMSGAPVVEGKGVITIPVTVLGCSGISTVPAGAQSVTVVLPMSLSGDFISTTPWTLVTLVPNVINALAATVNATSNSFSCQTVYEKETPPDADIVGADQSSPSVNIVILTSVDLAQILTKASEMALIQQQFAAAALPQPTSVSNTTSTSSQSLTSDPASTNDDSGSSRYSTGKLVGIIVGSVIGALLILAGIIVIYYRHGVSNKARVPAPVASPSAADIKSTYQADTSTSDLEAQSSPNQLVTVA